MKVVTTLETSRGVDFQEHDRVVSTRITPDELEGPVLYIEYTDRHGVPHLIEAKECKIV